MMYKFLALCLFLTNCAFVEDVQRTEDSKKDHAQRFYDVLSSEEEFSYKKWPSFKEYATSEKGFKKAKDVDLRSHPEGRKFRTVLRYGLKNGPNFAGHYAVVSHREGSDMSRNWIINVKTGKIITDFTSWGGVLVNVNSRLLIKNYAALTDRLTLLFVDDDGKSIEFCILTPNEKLKKIDAIKAEIYGDFVFRKRPDLAAEFGR